MLLTQSNFLKTQNSPTRVSVQCWFGIQIIAWSLTQGDGRRKAWGQRGAWSPCASLRRGPLLRSPQVLSRERTGLTHPQTGFCRSVPQASGEG